MNGTHGNAVTGNGMARRRPAGPLTPFGWTVAATALCAGLVLAGTHWQEALAVAVTCTVTLLAALTMSIGRVPFTGRLETSARRIKAGQKLELRVLVANQAHGRTGAAQAELRVGERMRQVMVPRLDPGQAHACSIRIEAQRRGVLCIGPLTVGKGDPLGLAWRARSVADGIEVFVHPHTAPPESLHIGGLPDMEGLAIGRVADNGLDLHTLRDYEAGDDPRHIHWLSSAKRGTLLVRRYEHYERAEVNLELDTQAAHYATDEEFELAVGLLASLGVACMRQGALLWAPQLGGRPQSSTALLDACSALVWNEGNPDDRHRVLPTGSGNDHRKAMTGGLPNVAETPDPGLASMPPSLALWVTGSRLNDDALRRQAVRMRGAASRRLLRACNGATGRVLAADGAMTLEVGSLEDLPRLWRVVL